LQKKEKERKEHLERCTATADMHDTLHRAVKKKSFYLTRTPNNNRMKNKN
jgi:hypothetical protein